MKLLTAIVHRFNRKKKAEQANEDDLFTYETIMWSFTSFTKST